MYAETSFPTEQMDKNFKTTLYYSPVIKTHVHMHNTIQVKLVLT